MERVKPTSAEETTSGVERDPQACTQVRRSCTMARCQSAAVDRGTQMKKCELYIVNREWSSVVIYATSAL